MKQIFVLLTVLSIAFCSNGQVRKGNWLLGGNINFSNTNVNSELLSKQTSYSIKISPNVGYFIMDKLAVGAKFSFDKTKSKTQIADVFPSTVEVSFMSNQVAGGPFARYYLLPVDKAYNILVEGTYRLGVMKDFKSHYGFNSLEFNAGPVVYLNPNIGIEFLVGYSSSKYFDYAGRNNTFQTGLGLQVHFKPKK